MQHVCGAREQPTGAMAANFFVDCLAELGGNCGNILSTSLDAKAIEYIIYFNEMIRASQYTLCGKYHFVDETNKPLKAQALMARCVQEKEGPKGVTFRNYVIVFSHPRLTELRLSVPLV